MAVRNVSYEIPSANHLVCISCDEVLESVTNAIEHTVVCRKKNRLANKYQGVDQIQKIKGSVRWTRANVAHFLSLLKKKVPDLGKAKAHYRTYELGKVHDEIASELADIIGPGITRYQVTRKWTLLQRHALQYEKLKKKQIKEGLPPTEPPSFHPSIKEIMRCVEEEKIRYLKEMEHSEKSYTLKLKEEELEIPEELCIDNKDDNFEFTEAMDDGDTGQLFHSEDGESGSIVLKRSCVLKVINQLEDGINYSDIIQEFGITKSVLSTIEQNIDAITQGAQRCSLCHILLSSNDDVVSHEIECSRACQSSKDSKGIETGKEDPLMVFMPKTVDKLVDVVLKWYPRFTRGVNWNKVASHLSHMQSGVTASRCSQKWHNLIAKCRKYQRLDRWAERKNYTHNNSPPDYYNQLIPYATSSLEIEPSQESVEKFLSIGPSAANKTNSLTYVNTKKRNLEMDSICNGNKSPKLTEDENDSSDNVEFYYDDDELESCIITTNIDEVDEDIKLEDTNSEGSDIHPDMKMFLDQNLEVSSTRFPRPKVESKSALLDAGPALKKKKLKNHKKYGKQVSGSSGMQVQRMHHLETKLDDVLGLLGDVVKENHRLRRESEMKEKSKCSQEEVAKKLEKLTKVFVRTHRQNLKQFQTMSKMWERHHWEHQAMIKALISEISKKTDHVKKNVHKC